jgi:hypothetical protein
MTRAPRLWRADAGGSRTAICHDPASITGGGLDLVSANQAARLVGVTSGVLDWATSLTTATAP